MSLDIPQIESSTNLKFQSQCFVENFVCRIFLKQLYLHSKTHIFPFCNPYWLQDKWMWILQIRNDHLGEEVYSGKKISTAGYILPYPCLSFTTHQSMTLCPRVIIRMISLELSLDICGFCLKICIICSTLLVYFVWHLVYLELCVCYTMFFNVLYQWLLSLYMNQSLISDTRGPRWRADRERSWPMFVHLPIYQ